MAYEFHEQVTLVLPDVDLALQEFTEAAGSKKGLVIELAAIHEGTTANHNYYGAEALEESLKSWVQPYPKPIITNHDLNSEAIGRVMAAKMDAEEDGTPYVRLQVAITDPTAIEKVLDQRYLTGSVGGKADEALCSICNADWSKATAFKTACKHQRGKVYKVDGKEQRAFINMKKISFKEYSIVNAPADHRSSIRTTTSPADTVENKESDDGWVRPNARVFAIDMNKEEIVEYTESEDRNVLLGMKKKDSAPLYLGVKGAFLSALAVHESEEDSVEDEDILAVSEELSANLSEDARDGDPVDGADKKNPHSFKKRDNGDDDGHCQLCGLPLGDDVHSKKEESTDDTLNSNDQPEAEETPEAEAEAEEEATEEETLEEEVSAEEGAPVSNAPFNQDPPDFSGPTNRPEAQAKRHAIDINPDTSANAPINRQSEEDALISEKELQELQQTNMELNEKVTTLESRIEELETREATLSEENAKLKTALKRSMVERVVDTKIALRMVEKADREAQIEEHMGRSASSLADSLRDLAGMRPEIDYSQMPTVEGNSVAIPVNGKNDEKVITINPDDGSVVHYAETNGNSKESTKREPVEFFTELLMGKRKA